MWVFKQKSMIMTCIFIFLLGLFCGVSLITAVTAQAGEAKALSGSAQAGKGIFEEVNCLMCHLLHGEGGGLEKAPDFAGVSQRLKSDEMKKWLKGHLYEEPRLSMFEEDPTDEDMQHLTDYLQTL